MKGRVLALALLLLSPATAAAEWQYKPFLGVIFGGETTLIDPEAAAGHTHVAVGFGTLLIGEMLGVEADLGVAPSFFSAGEDAPAGLEASVVRSSVTTLTGNVVIAVPRRLTQYTLRPYFVGGGGMIHARSLCCLSALPVATTLPTMDIGGGVTGFLTNRLGVSWDVRYFRSIGNSEISGSSFGPEQLSFWRANMALAIRY